MCSFLFFFSLDGHRMWTKVSLNDEHIQMIISLLIFIFSINFTNGINNNQTNITSKKDLFPVETLLNQQYDHRQMINNQTTNTIRPWKKSNSIEILKKMIANRQRSTTITTTRLSTSTIPTS